MTVRHRVALLAIVMTLGITASSFASHAWGNYHWARKSNPFVLRVHDNVTAKWESHLDTARVDWNRSSILDLNVIWNSPLSSPKRCSSATGVIEVCNERYGATGWLGIAGISASGGHITKAYTKLNDTYFDTARYNTPAWRNMVTCQEIGHDFGLAHQDENFSNTNLGSCMDYTNDPSGRAGTNGTANNEHPNQHDYDMIAAIYNHNDSTTTIALDEGLRMVASSLMVPTIVAGDHDDGGEEPWQWGTPVGFDHAGRANRYYLELGNGEVRITHVLWAPDENPRGRNPHDDEHQH